MEHKFVIGEIPPGIQMELDAFDKFSLFLDTPQRHRDFDPLVLAQSRDVVRKSPPCSGCADPQSQRQIFFIRTVEGGVDGKFQIVIPGPVLHTGRNTRVAPGP